MSKKILVVILGFLLFLIPITYFYVQHQEFLARRHYLLCEILKPGMSKEEVLRILRQEGEISVGDSDSPRRAVELRLNYKDTKGSQKYGAFNLFFLDDKYMRAYVRLTSDDSELICDFYQATPSISPVEIITSEPNTNSSSQ